MYIQLHRSKPGLLLLVLVILSLTSCEESIIVQENPDEDFVKIYLNESSQDVYAIDIKATGNDTYTIFGVAGNSIESVFDGNGSLYLLHVDLEGEFLWDTNLVIGPDKSFPGNIIELAEDEYFMIWNNEYGQQNAINLKIKGESVSASISSINTNAHFGYIPYVNKAIDPSNGFVLCTIGHEEINNQKFRYFYILRTDQQFTDITETIQYKYNPYPISGYKDNDRAFLEMVNNYLYIGHNGDNYFFFGPVGNMMTLMFVDNDLPVYQDSSYWISSINNFENGYINCLMNQPFSYFVKDLDLKSSGLSGEIVPNYSLALSLDPKKPAFITDNWVIGTLPSQQVTILGIDDSEAYVLGSKYPYEAGGVIEDSDGNLLILGTTKVNYIYQRLFLIKYKF